ncbi:MAG: dTDP-4-dehydrorhamnose reductase [Betaproteobacteria bacterium]|nr:dTDP-4-dehydrorhamnose reductase [Betaproteobacteria bacterium]
MSAPAKVLITGGEGQLGFELARALQSKAEIFALDRHALDLSNPDSIIARCREIKPALILNPGAYTAVDRAESEPDLAMKINGIAPGILGEEARRLGVPVMHFSTDYVFDGTATAPYRETDSTNPQNVYGRTKLAGEIALAQSGATHFTFRTSWLYGNRRQNFYLTMLRLARERDELRVVADQIGAPTWVRPLAGHALQAVRQEGGRIGAAIEPDLYHLTARGQTSWHGFAEAILVSVPDPARRAKRVNAIATAEFPTPAARPAFSVLSNAKLAKALGVEMGDWDAALAQCAHEWTAANNGS